LPDGTKPYVDVKHPKELVYSEAFFRTFAPSHRPIDRQEAAEAKKAWPEASSPQPTPPGKSVHSRDVVKRPSYMPAIAIFQERPSAHRFLTANPVTNFANHAEPSIDGPPAARVHRRRRLAFRSSPKVRDSQLLAPPPCIRKSL